MQSVNEQLYQQRTIEVWKGSVQTRSIDVRVYGCKTVWYRTVMYFNFNTDSSSAENLVEDDHMYVGTRIRMQEDQTWIGVMFYYCQVEYGEYGRMGDGSGLIKTNESWILVGWIRTNGQEQNTGLVAHEFYAHKNCLLTCKRRTRTEACAQRCVPLTTYLLLPLCSSCLLSIHYHPFCNVLFQFRAIAVLFLEAYSLMVQSA